MVTQQYSNQRIQIIHPSSPRLSHLSDCEQPTVYNVSGNWLGAVRLQVKCDDWMLYWPIQVSVFDQVVQLANDVSANQVITAQDLSMVEHDISKLRLGYFTSIDDVEGSQAQRSLRAGMILNQRIIEPPTKVSRGDKVVIIGTRPGLQVSMTGTALESGALGEQITVTNLSSGRRLAATIVGEKVVQVTLAP
ncbi:flagellar basal body P-ring formation chaperone FlgA [Salinibius halmophilus]|uniref:flagellar basal body P-ring formation chaperone FlgA n=1 Tax=Salinibius halmophilus TaxID=1853216 RepID=UPI000E673C43|nr:flagellar basal body P-ring formation chaperone FlgA [Salinibius halmophilus]